MSSLALLLAGIFGVLAALHVYWGFGGRRGAAAALPTKPDGELLFRPGLFACFVVAAGLVAFGALALMHVGLWPQPEFLPSTRWLVRSVAAIFALRTLGDFRYVGLTRTVHNTRFARRDRAFYTPLCAGLAVGLFVLATS